MRLKKLWARVPRGTVLLSVVAAVNVVLGFAREGVIAYYYGTSAELDTFLVAYTLPRLVVMQAVQITVSIILPLYVGHIEAGRREDATALLRRWFVFLAKAMTILCVAVVALAGPLTYLIAPGLTDAQRHDAAMWLRGLLPYVWVITLSGCFKVVLDQNRRFFMPAMSAAFVSIAVMIACTAGASTWGVAAMVPGYFVGGLIGFLWQWKQSNTYEPKLMSFRDMPLHIQLPLASGGIMVFNSFAQQANLIIDRAFASSLPDGSIAALNYANSLLMVPQSILSTAVATALFPVLAELIVRGSWKQAFRTTIAWTGVVLGLCMIPVIGLMLWRVPLVGFVFQRGKFDQSATHMTATALVVLSFMLLITSCNALILRLLLAQQQLRLILITTVLAVVLKIIANLVLTDTYGLIGISAATVIAASLAAVFRYIGAWRYTPPRVEPAR